jgi:hypothetical protein
MWQRVDLAVAAASSFLVDCGDGAVDFFGRDGEVDCAAAAWLFFI